MQFRRLTPSIGVEITGLDLSRPLPDADFAAVRLVTVEKVFGGWGEVMKTHFGEGGVLDQVFVNR